MIDTKNAPRRQLDFRTLADISAELDRLEAAHREHGLKQTGNWTPGQNLDHLARFMQRTFDGFESLAPAPFRAVMRLVFFKAFTAPGKPIPAGYKLPKQAAPLLPPPEVSTEQGLSNLRAQIARAARGERMTQKSPLIGPLTHEQWETVHAKHAALHLGFIAPAS